MSPSNCSKCCKVLLPLSRKIRLHQACNDGAEERLLTDKTLRKNNELDGELGKIREGSLGIVSMGRMDVNEEEGTSETPHSPLGSLEKILSPIKKKNEMIGAKKNELKKLDKVGEMKEVLTKLDKLSEMKMMVQRMKEKESRKRKLSITTEKSVVEFTHVEENRSDVKVIKVPGENEKRLKVFCGEVSSSGVETNQSSPGHLKKMILRLERKEELIEEKKNELRKIMYRRWKIEVGIVFMII